MLKQEGHQNDEVESVKIDEVSVKYDMYYAFNKGTDDQVIQQFQQMLDRVKQTERYNELVKKYIRPV